MKNLTAFVGLMGVCRWRRRTGIFYYYYYAQADGSTVSHTVSTAATWQNCFAAINSGATKMLPTRHLARDDNNWNAAWRRWRPDGRNAYREIQPKCRPTSCYTNHSGCRSVKYTLLILTGRVHRLPRGKRLGVHMGAPAGMGNSSTVLSLPWERLNGGCSLCSALSEKVTSLVITIRKTPFRPS